jgi:hypothetical protein
VARRLGGGRARGSPRARDGGSPRREIDRIIGLALLLSLWPCLGAIRNGQTNLAFGGLLLLAAALLSAEKWTAAAAVLVLLVAVKPLGLVVILLAPWGYPRLIARLTAGLAVLAALPFLFAPPSWVLAQYHDAVAHLASWSGTSEPRFADLAALLRHVGVALTPGAATVLRAVAAVAVLLLWIAAARRRVEPSRALTLALLAATYLLLFNPMTERTPTRSRPRRWASPRVAHSPTGAAPRSAGCSPRRSSRSASSEAFHGIEPGIRFGGIPSRSRRSPRGSLPDPACRRPKPCAALTRASLPFGL